jgi:hypothetical protein
MKKVADDVLPLTGIHMSTLEVYNHIIKVEDQLERHKQDQIRSQSRVERAWLLLYLENEERLQEYPRVISFMEFHS